MAGKQRSRKRMTLSKVILTMLLVLSFIVLILLGLRILSMAPIISEDDVLKSHDLTSIVREMTVDSDEREKQWVEVISWEPRAFVYHNFMSKEECEHIIELARPYMIRSTVIATDNETGVSSVSSVRTSTGMFLTRGADDVIRNIEKRIAEFTFIPIENGEGLQVLHYGVGEKYEPHSDYFVDRFNIGHGGGQRVATLLMYLSDVEEGGETYFPAAPTNNNSAAGWKADEPFDCRKYGGLMVKPKMGNALLFWDLKPDATEDINSLHGGCPVIKGDKWSATKWMHLKSM